MICIGQIIDNRYKIIREIGRGGTSCVYLAENIRLHNHWAIKEVYKSAMTGSGMGPATLVAESHILTRLSHKGLPTIVDIIDTPQAYLLVMEYVEGVSLDKVLEKQGAQSQENVLKWAKQLCDVLEYLHSQPRPIIYRDMKPANIMLRPDGTVVLIDFGMAREFKNHTRHDTTNLGTHGYAAPEQYNGTRQSDARTDIYSLGVTLYHLVTGHDPCLPPYGINPICTINPTLSPQLDQIIQKCTQLRAEDRFQSARELNEAISSINPKVRVAVDFSAEKTPKSSSGWVWALVAVPLALLLLIVVIFAGIQSTSRSFFDMVGNIGSYFTENYNTPEDEVLFYEQEVEITEPDQREYYTYTAERTGWYEIYSVSGEVVPVVWLYNEDDEDLTKDNTTGDYNDFYISWWMREGETYTIETTLYDLNPSVPATGSFLLYLEYIGNDL